MSRLPTTLLLAVLVLGTVLTASAADARYGGVELYADTDFRGRSADFDRDVPDLGDTAIGNDRASSIRVARGCRATLFADTRYRGRSVEIRDDTADLGRTAIGNDRASSMRVDCHRDEWDRGGRDDWDGRDDWSDDRPARDGVTLFEDEEYRGRRTVITRDMESLRHLDVGNDRASSIRVARGCRAILHSDERFRGRSDTIDRDEPALSRTRVGNDALSSIEVRCRGFSGGGRDNDGVTLFEDNDFRGRSTSFDRDVRDLGRTPFGNDRASSIRVPSGCIVELFEHEDYRGRSVRLDHDVDALGRTPLGNDRLSSMKVDCWQR